MSTDNIDKGLIARHKAKSRRSKRNAQRLAGHIKRAGSVKGGVASFNKAYDPIEVVLDRLAEQCGEAIAKSLDDLIGKKRRRDEVAIGEAKVVEKGMLRKTSRLNRAKRQVAATNPGRLGAMKLSAELRNGDMRRGKGRRTKVREGTTYREGPYTTTVGAFDRHKGTYRAGTERRNQHDGSRERPANYGTAEYTPRQLTSLRNRSTARPPKSIVMRSGVRIRKDLDELIEKGMLRSWHGKGMARAKRRDKPGMLTSYHARRLRRR